MRLCHIGWGLACSAALLWAPAHARAQSPVLTEGPVAASPLTVYLVTIGPGDAVWERFGHNALWIHDARTGQDIWWNWGLFSFSQEGFLLRLARGDMLYSMGGRDMRAELAQYRAQQRDVWAQQLNLTATQALELDRFVRRNAQPANRDYIYDYYEDNCSTRVRDAIDQVLGGALEAHFSARPVPTTWRMQTRRHVEVSSLTDVAVALVLGRPGDREITAWQQMFLPLELRRHLGSLLLEGPDGAMRPLVVDEMHLIDAGRTPPPERASPRWPAMLLLGLGIAVVALVLGVAGRRSAVARAALAMLVGAWSLLAGVGGFLLAAAWFTDHDFWVPNENLLQASPLSLVLALVVLGAILRPSLWGVASRIARWVAALALLGVLVKLVPLGVSQDNLQVLALALPVHLAAAWALRQAREA